MKSSLVCTSVHKYLPFDTSSTYFYNGVDYLLFPCHKLQSGHLPKIRHKEGKANNNMRCAPFYHIKVNKKLDSQSQLNNITILCFRPLVELCHTWRKASYKSACMKSGLGGPFCKHVMSFYRSIYLDTAVSLSSWEV